jgi:hypothetical protein
MAFFSFFFHLVRKIHGEVLEKIKYRSKTLKWPDFNLTQALSPSHQFIPDGEPFPISMFQ